LVTTVVSDLGWFSKRYFACPLLSPGRCTVADKAVKYKSYFIFSLHHILNHPLPLLI